MTDRILTYDELAEALGRSGEAVRALVIRKRWRRTIGNDGKARVYVPEEAVEPLRSPSAARVRSRSEAPPEAPPQPSPSAAPTEATSQAPVIALLHARIAELAAELRETRDTLAEAQTKAARVDALEALRAQDMERLNDVKADRDRWVGIAEALRQQTERLAAPVAAPGPVNRIDTNTVEARGWWPFRRRA